MPALASLHRTERPVEEVTHVGEDLNGLTTTSIEGREAVRSAFESPGGAVGEGGNGVADKFAIVSHTEKLYRNPEYNLSE